MHKGTLCVVKCFSVPLTPCSQLSDSKDKLILEKTVRSQKITNFTHNCSMAQSQSHMTKQTFPKQPANPEQLQRQMLDQCISWSIGLLELQLSGEQTRFAESPHHVPSGWRETQNRSPLTRTLCTVALLVEGGSQHSWLMELDSGKHWSVFCTFLWSLQESP